MLLIIEELGGFPFTSRNQRIVHHYTQYFSGISQKRKKTRKGKKKCLYFAYGPACGSTDTKSI